MDYRKWGDPEIEDWEDDPNSRKKLYAYLWEFGLGCYPSDSCSPWCCRPIRDCWPRRGCWPWKGCCPR